MTKSSYLNPNIENQYEKTCDLYFIYENLDQRNVPP